MTMSLGLHLGLGHHRGSSGGGSPAVNTVAPAITGTRGGTLTATPGTWTGATSVSGQWYADGVATGNTTTSFTDSDTSKSLEYRETALPGGVVASGYLGVQDSTALYSEDFSAYADGTRLAERYNTTNTTTFAATATPHVSGWDGIGYMPNGDTDTTGNAQALRIVGGKVRQQNLIASGAAGAVVRDFGVQSGNWDFKLSFVASSKRQLEFSASAPNTVSTTGITVVFNNNGFVGQLIINASGLGQLANLTNLPLFVSTDTWRIKIDATAKLLFVFRNGTAVGNPAGYDLSAWAGPWTSKAGFQTAVDSSNPVAGSDLCDSIVFDTLTSNSVVATLNNQPSGAVGKKQIDISATIGMTGATGAEYKIETEAGAFVQGWTALTYSAGTGTGTFPIPDFAFQGQKLKAIVRNIGGTVKTASALTATNNYVLEQKMRLGLNDSWQDYWGNQVPGRDLFAVAPFTTQIMTVGSTSDRVAVMPKGQDFTTYQSWNQPYNATQLYPATTDSDDHRCCVLNGIMFRRVDGTPRSGVSPSTADPSGSTTGWAMFSYGHSDVVGLTSAGLPTKLPDDSNLTIAYFPPWKLPTARYPATFHCKTEPGVKWNLVGSGVTMQNVNLAAGTFDLLYTGDATPWLKVDRSTPISSAFFISGVPTWETGTPSADIGVPYAGLDKVADYAPFYGRRNIHGDPVVEIFAGTPIGGWTAANNVPASGRIDWKLTASLANQAGHKMVWVNVPDLADGTYIDAMAVFYLNNLNAGIDVYVEVGNERWNWQYSNPSLLLARSRALDPADPAYSPPTGDNKHLLHARETAAVVARWKAVWGAQASRVKGVLAWQTATPTSTWQAMLDIDGNAYQNIGAIATAPYMNTDGSGKDIGSFTNTPQNIRDAVAANDQTAFNAAADTQMRSALTYEVGITRTLFDWLPGYSISKGLNKDAIGLVSYEASQHVIVNEANWDSGLGAGMGARASAMTTAYKQSATYAATHALYIDTMAQQCPHLMMLFDYVGSQTGDTWWAHLTRTGNQTDEPYATAKAKALALNV